MNDDTPMHRVPFVGMTTADQDAFLEGIRTRRLAAVAAYQALQQAKRAARDERLAARADNELRMMEKELAALDKALEKVEARRAKLTAIKLLVEQE